MKIGLREDLETRAVLDFLESKQAGGKLYLIILKCPHSWPRNLPGWPGEHIEDSWPAWGRDFGILDWASIWDLGIHYWGIYLGGRH